MTEAEWWANGQHDAPPAPMCDVDENPEVGRILGPDGQVIAIVRARAKVPFGFSPGPQ